MKKVILLLSFFFSTLACFAQTAEDLIDDAFESCAENWFFDRYVSGGIKIDNAYESDGDLVVRGTYLFKRGLSQYRCEFKATLVRDSYGDVSVESITLTDCAGGSKSTSKCYP